MCGSCQVRLLGQAVDELGDQRFLQSARPVLFNLFFLV